MTNTTRTIGTRMTERRVKAIDGLAWLDEKSRHNANYRDVFDAHIADTKKRAYAILDDAGIPERDTAKRRLLDVEKQGFKPFDSSEWYAARILFEIAGIRAAIDREDGSVAATLAIQLGELIQEAVMKERWERTVEHAQKFGSKPRRTDALTKAIDAALSSLGPKTSAKAVLKYIEDDEDGPIQEIKSDKIYWRRANGREAELSIKTFNNRVSKQRNFIK